MNSVKATSFSISNCLDLPQNQDKLQQKQSFLWEILSIFQTQFVRKSISLGESKLQNILETPFKENNRVGRKQNGCLCSAQKYTWNLIKLTIALHQISLWHVYFPLSLHG